MTGKSRLGDSGFSAIELLITLFIAVMFLVSGYQLYATVIKDSDEIRMSTSANNVANDYLQRYKPSSTNPCTPQEIMTDSSITVTGLTDVTVSVSIECPYSNASADECTGGTITHDDAYTVHRFTSSGTLSCTGSFPAETLVVGGGGSGPSGNSNVGSGGGGAGGYKTGTQTISGNMTVVVGSGGTANNNNAQNSSFGSYTAYAGGSGGGTGAFVGVGQHGGSGGGSAGSNKSVGNGTRGQGFEGGIGYGTYGSTATGGGGGGGAKSAGAAATLGTAPGAGGSGISDDIVKRGTYVTYAVGGSGAAQAGPAGTAGTANTGNGGGGGGGGGMAGAAGGSGIVVVRYLTPSALTAVSKVIVTVKYGNPQQIVTSATYVNL